MFESYRYYAGTATQTFPTSNALNGQGGNPNCPTLQLCPYALTISNGKMGTEITIIPIFVIDGVEYLYNFNVKEFKTVSEATGGAPTLLGSSCYTPVNRIAELESATDEEKELVVGIAGMFAAQYISQAGTTVNNYQGTNVNGYGNVKIKWHRSLKIYYYYAAASEGNLNTNNLNSVIAAIATAMYNNDSGLYWTRFYSIQIVTIGGNVVVSAASVPGGSLLTLNSIILSLLGILGIIGMILVIARAYGRKDYVTMLSLLIPFLTGYALSGMQLYVGTAVGLFAAIEYYLYDALSIIVLMISEIIYVVAAGILEFASLYEFSEFLSNILFIQSVSDFVEGIENIANFQITGAITTTDDVIPTGFTVNANYQYIANGLIDIVQGSLDFIFANATGITGMLIVTIQLVLGYGLLAADTMWTALVPSKKYRINVPSLRY
ncbi:MAG: hypothetical protein [aquatic viral metagenome]